jgi:hypothetical protein
MRTGRTDKNVKESAMNERKIARLCGLALGGLLAAGLVLNAMAF